MGGGHRNRVAKTSGCQGSESVVAGARWIRRAEAGGSRGIRPWLGYVCSSTAGDSALFGEIKSRRVLLNL